MGTPSTASPVDNGGGTNVPSESHTSYPTISTTTLPTIASTGLPSASVGGTGNIGGDDSSSFFLGVGFSKTMLVSIFPLSIILL